MKMTFLKRFAILSLLVSLSVMLSGCGSTSVFDGSKAANEGGFQMDYAVLNREESADLYLDEGDQLEVVIAQTSGDVDVTVGLPEKDPLYRGNRQQNGEFSLPVSEAGTYHISVTGHQAKGSVSFIRVPAGE